MKFITTFTGIILAISSIITFFKSCEDEKPIEHIKAEFTVNISSESINQPLKVEIETPEQIEKPVTKKHSSTTKKIKIPIEKAETPNIEPDCTDKINFISKLQIATGIIWIALIFYILLIANIGKTPFSHIFLLLATIIVHYILIYQGISLLNSSDILTIHDNLIFMWIAGLNISMILILGAITAFYALINLQNFNKSLYNFFRVCLVSLEIPAIIVFISWITYN